MPAFQIAGGLLLLLMGIEQLHGSHNKVKREEKEEGLHKEDISVFPLATPLLAGPGAIATVVLQSNEAKSVQHVGVLVLSIIGAMLASYATLKSGTYLFRVLGKTGLNLLTRIMGILLTAIAVQYIANGILEMFK